MSRLGIASLLVAAVGACDPATLRHTPDAAIQIDAAPDAPDHGPVTVTLYDPNNAGTLFVGAPIVFIEADGTLAARPVTDSAGMVSADVHPNATATALVAGQGTTTMITLAGIQPGDHIILGNSTASTSTVDGMFTVSFPAYNGAASYNVIGPCGNYYAGNVTTYALTIYSYCKQSAMDLLVVANDSSNLPIAYLEKPNVAYTPGGTTAVTGSYLLPGTFNASYTNIDASITALSYTRNAPASNGYGAGASGTPANGMLSLSGLAFNAQTSSVQTRTIKSSEPNDFSIVVQNMPGNALSYSLDVGATLLPFIGPMTVDLANKKVAVNVDSTGTSTDKPDLFYMNLTYSRTNGSAGTTIYRWYVLAPEPGDVTLPALPPEVGDVLPQATDTANSIVGLSLDTSNSTWDTVRVAPFDFLNNVGQTSDTTSQLRDSVYQPRVVGLTGN